MSDYKLTFKLKQHMPIIHFQHNQSGATLRATELKPKLDRFLIEKLGKGDYEQGIQIAGDKGWLIGDGEHPALDYKVRVESNEIETKKIPEGRHNQYGAFFGTIGNEYRQNPKGLSFAENELNLTISCFNNDLKNYIDKYIIPFFEITNFGTRQSKGFGSFSITKKIKDNKEIETKFDNSTYKTYFDIDLNNNDWFNKYKEASNTIVLLYKAIRSGINLKRNRGQDDRFYFKSLMFLYAKNLGIQWEKKTIKESFFSRELSAQKQNRPNSDPLNYHSNTKKLMKDLLGLSSEESWFSYRATIKKKEAKYNNVRNQWEEAINNLKFERFKSPILFKPILINQSTLRVYIFLNQEELNFALSVNKDFVIRNGRNSFHIKYPDNFSLNDFFDFFLDKNNFNINTHVEIRFHNQNEFQILKKLFSQMRNNKK